MEQVLEQILSQVHEQVLQLEDAREKEKEKLENEELETEGQEVLQDDVLDLEVEEGSSWTRERAYGIMPGRTFYRLKKKLATLIQMFPIQEAVELLSVNADTTFLNFRMWHVFL